MITGRFWIRIQIYCEPELGFYLNTRIFRAYNSSEKMVDLFQLHEIVSNLVGLAKFAGGVIVE
jgi:hypothetical protein